ncbi:hypothetical protein HY947_03785 [Candidatus Gottesmanbacteria bacterium]|nr:hypothetical protein [Candidatus Gottesmanbacteria bacterium]
MINTLVLSPVNIFYIQSSKGLAGAVNTFNILESKLTTLKGRKFYGVVYGKPPNETYWACVAKRDEKEVLDGCESGKIPGGKYIGKRVNDWEDNIPEIGKAFQELMTKVTLDYNRPFVEYYHGMNYMIARVPVV